MTMTTTGDTLTATAARMAKAATLIACGVAPERSILYRQSDMPEVCELTWILGCTCAKGLLNRAHAYKAATAANVALGREPDRGVNMGLFGYPLLMAADILIHRAEAVPVGRDQSQHVEIARDVAESFNRIYGPVLLVPELVVDERVMTIPGLDGRKMSKSYGNQIALSATPDEIRRRVARIVTDSRPPSEPKEPDTILSLYRSVAPEADARDLERRYRAGGVGYGEAKALLTEAIERVVAPQTPAFNVRPVKTPGFGAPRRAFAQRTFAVDQQMRFHAQPPSITTSCAVIMWLPSKSLVPSMAARFWNSVRVAPGQRQQTFTPVPLASL